MKVYELLEKINRLVDKNESVEYADVCILEDDNIYEVKDDIEYDDNYLPTLFIKF